MAAAAAAREAAVAAGLLDPSQLGKLTDSLMDCLIDGHVHFADQSLFNS